MTLPTTLKFGKFKIEIGDGATPEVFTAPCGFTQKSFNRTKALNEVQIPDCDDPDAPVVTARDVASISWSVAGQGVLAGESLAMWDAFFNSTTSRNIKITEQFASPIGDIVWTGKAHLESFEKSGQVGQRVTANVSLQGDGALTRSPALS